MRRPLAALVTLGAYFAGVHLGLAFAVTNHSISAVWPPAGIALAALYLEGRDMRSAAWITAAIFTGALLGNATTGAGDACWGIAVGNTGEAIVATCILRVIGFAPDFHRESRVVAFMVAALIASALAATVGTFTLHSDGKLPLSGYAFAWRTWWLGDTTGMLVWAPVFMLARAEGRSQRTCLVVAVGLFTVLAAVLTHENIGPFVSKAGLDYNLLLEQIVMGGIAISVLVVTATFARKKQSSDKLQEALREAHRLIGDSK